MRRILICIGVIALPLTSAAPDDSSHSPSCEVTPTVQATPPKDPQADDFGSGPWYVNEDRSLWAGWDAVRLKSGRNKVLWIRPAGSELVVSARRVDGASGKFEAEVPCCYPTGFQASGLRFDTPGCWEISAKAGNASLKFIAQVQPR